MQKLLLIDGNSLINRAFYATPLLTTKSGVFTNAVYGFLNMFFKSVSELSPTHACVAFDLKAPTFRHKLYDGYKATRHPMPNELAVQVPLLKEILKLMGVSVCQKEGLEADDLIGTIAKKTDFETVIITGDRDSFQLVDKTTKVLFTRRGITDTEELNDDNFKTLTGLVPSQIIDLKSLMGDSSDNIPGVPGIGEKTAKTLLDKYGTLDGVYAHLDEINGKLQEKLADGKESAYLSYTLATINVDCDIPVSPDLMILPKTFSDQVRAKFVELELRSLYSRSELFDGGTTEKAPKRAFTTETATSLEIPEYLNTAERISVFATDGFISVSDGNRETRFPYAKTLLDDGFTRADAVRALSPLFCGNKTLIAFDKKELCHYLDDVGCALTAFCHDVSVMKYLCDYTGKAETAESVIIAYGLDENAPAASLTSAFNTLYEKLKAENTLELYEKVELPLTDVLYAMERSGFKMDVAALNEAGKKYYAETQELEGRIRELAGDETLNVNSPRQLGEVLFDKLKIGKGKKTKNGYSTGAEILEGLESAHPIVPLILQYRKIQKLNSTYIEGFKPLLDKQTGIIRTSFNQTVTSTGRLSSKEPNLQNIPVRDEEGRELRKLFVPKSDDRILISADYSQIELRLLAAFSECKPLIAAFKEGKDIHASTAAKVFGVPIDSVTREMRSQAKAVNFGIIYGISEYGLAKNLNVPAYKARDYIEAYFRQYPAVKEYMERNVAFAKKTGYAITMLGRRRYIRELHSAQYNMRQFGERAAMNMPLQGSSADIIKIAMIRVYDRLKREGLRSELILQIHDELILDAFAAERERAEKILVEEMEHAVELSVPLTVSVECGKTWFDAK